MQKKFNFEVVKNGVVVAGLDSKNIAEDLAKQIGGQVQEAAIATIIGDMSFNSGSVYFVTDDGNTLQEAVAKAMGIKFPASNRGAGNTIELGYVTITIKQAVDNRAQPELVDH